MIVGADSTFLLYFFAPAGTVLTPLDENGGQISFAKERVQGLIAELEKASAKVIVGTPALSEIMVRTGVVAGQSYVKIMRASKAFRIVPFDEKAAIEVAIMAGHSTAGAAEDDLMVGTKAKVKYDRQIVAIAHTEGASTFFTDDGNQGKLAQRLGMKVRGLTDCLVPTEVAQADLWRNPGE